MRRTVPRRRLTCHKRTAHRPERAWLIGVALFVAAASVIVVVRCSAQSSGGQTSVYFHTLPPGATLPSGSECARLVNASPSPEVRPENARFNHTVGQRVSAAFFPAGDSPQVKKLARLISGDFTGTTEDILRWAACKWGIDQDVVFAEAAIESWWQQTYLGDWTTDVTDCPPGHGLGADGIRGECPQSYGILQNKYRFGKDAWPGLALSTAMNADAMYAIWRSCYDGYEVWLNNAPRGRQYSAGDLWGCIGRWYAGSWYTPAADRYISRVKRYLSEQVWLQPDFADRQ
jgi:hypothetical protein